VPRALSVVVGTPRLGQALTRSRTDNVGIDDDAAGSTGEFPTTADTGAAPGAPTLGDLVVENGETINYDNRVINSVFVRPGATVILSNCTVTEGIGVQPQVGQPALSIDLDHVKTTNGGIGIGVLDSAGVTLDYTNIVNMTFNTTWCYIFEPKAFQPDHTEALACFGQASGARFHSTTWVQEGNNGLADGVTAITNFNGRNTVFEECLFRWQSGPAAPYMVYMRAKTAGGHTNNGITVLNSAFKPDGTSVIVYPNDVPGGEQHALYSGCFNYDTGVALTLP
jgi:hypothetical protein